MAEIKSIKYIGKQDVYNLEVDVYHNFSINGGLIVHNCGMGLVAYHAEQSKAPEAVKTRLQKYKEKLARQGQYDDMHARALNS